jgi:hypothetical protein
MDNVMTRCDGFGELPWSRFKTVLFFRIQAADQATEDEESQDSHGT